MATHTITKTLQTNVGIVIDDPVILTGDEEIEIDGTIADTISNQLERVAFQRSHCKSFWLRSDQPLTIKTNSSSAPADTFTLAAKTPIEWALGDSGAVPLTADITALYITNASGHVAAYRLRFLVDSTL